MKRLASLLLLVALSGCVLPDVGGTSTKAPFPSIDGLRVIIIEDTSPKAIANYSTPQREILQSEAPGSVLEWCKKNCVEDGFRPNVSSQSTMERDTKVWQLAVKAKRPELPCILAANKSRGTSLAITKTTSKDAVLKALQSVKGK